MNMTVYLAQIQRRNTHLKKFLALLLALVMALSLVACGKKDDDS